MALRLRAWQCSRCPPFLVRSLCSLYVRAVASFTATRLSAHREGTLGPCPVAFNEVSSVAELAQELVLGHAITHVRAKSLDEIWHNGLRWADQYDCECEIVLLACRGFVRGALLR